MIPSGANSSLFAATMEAFITTWLDSATLIFKVRIIGHRYRYRETIPPITGRTSPTFPVSAEVYPPSTIFNC